MEQQKSQKIIFTIGHSNRPPEEFISLLNSFGILMLVDVRNFPSSKRYPHFNKETLQALLREKEIDYLHLKELGGRRKPQLDSVNTRWRNTAFRGYADYMATEDFKNSISILEKIAAKEPSAYMCAEAVWWSCHRALISDYLKIRGWKVMHIMSEGKATEHPFTSAARVTNNQLRYDDPELFE